MFMCLNLDPSERQFGFIMHKLKHELSASEAAKAALLHGVSRPDVFLFATWQHAQ